MKTNSNSRRKILKFLDRNEATTTAIAIATGMHYYSTYHELMDLEKEGIIVREDKPHQTFWKLKEGDSHGPQ